MGYFMRLAGRWRMGRWIEGMRVRKISIPAALLGKTMKVIPGTINELAPWSMDETSDLLDGRNLN